MVTTRSMSQKWFVTKGKSPTLLHRSQLTDFRDNSLLPVPRQLTDLVDEIHKILDPGLLMCAGEAVSETLLGNKEVSVVEVKRRLVHHLLPGLVESYTDEWTDEVLEEFEEYVDMHLDVTEELSIKEILKALEKIGEEYNELEYWRGHQNNFLK